MKSEEIEILIKYRLEQAQTALDDAKYMIDGKINRRPTQTNADNFRVKPQDRNIRLPPKKNTFSIFLKRE